jgi:hypothetical protein
MSSVLGPARSEENGTLKQQWIVVSAACGELIEGPGWAAFLGWGLRPFMGMLGRPIPKLGLILSDQCRTFANLFMMNKGRWAAWRY